MQFETPRGGRGLHHFPNFSEQRSLFFVREHSAGLTFVEHIWAVFMKRNLRAHLQRQHGVTEAGDTVNRAEDLGISTLSSYKKIADTKVTGLWWELNSWPHMAEHPKTRLLRWGWLVCLTVHIKMVIFRHWGWRWGWSLDWGKVYEPLSCITYYNEV